MDEVEGVKCWHCGGHGKVWMQEYKEWWGCGVCSGTGDSSYMATCPFPVVNTSSEFGISGTCPSGEFYETVKKAREENQRLSNEYENPSTIMGKVKKFLLS